MLRPAWLAWYVAYSASQNWLTSFSLSAGHAVDLSVSDSSQVCSCALSAGSSFVTSECCRVIAQVPLLWSMVVHRTWVSMVMVAWGSPVTWTVACLYVVFSMVNYLLSGLCFGSTSQMASSVGLAPPLCWRLDCHWMESYSVLSFSVGSGRGWTSLKSPQFASRWGLG